MSANHQEVPAVLDMSQKPRVLSTLSGSLKSALSLSVLVIVAAFVLSYAFGSLGLQIVTLTLVQLAAVLAVSVYTGNTGAVSFGHAAMMAIGAYTAGILTMSAGVQATALPQLPQFLARHELSLSAALIWAALAGLVFGLVTGMPIRRMSGDAAAVATLAFLIITNVILIGAQPITRGSQTFYGVPRLTTFWVALIGAVVLIAIARIYRDLPSGLSVRASRDNDVAAASVGVDVHAARYRAWVLSAVMTSVAGALYGCFLGAFSPKDFYFDLTFGLLAMLIVGGMYTVSGAIAGTVFISFVVQVLRRLESGIDVGQLHIPGMFGLPLLGMAAAVLIIVWRRPAGLAGLREFSFFRPEAPPQPALAIPRPASTGAGESPGMLDIRQVRVQFGGLVAIDDVSFSVPASGVVGLIGPNGAGKTTLINVICGQLRATSGTVMLDGARIDRMPSASIARAGLARTVQNIRVFEKMTVLENIAAAALSTGCKLHEAREIAAAEMERLGLTEFHERLAGTLAYGPRRRLEIARALALKPKFLLLDEPAAGMNPRETEELFGVLTRIRSDFDLGIIVVEHDLHFIMRFCDRIVVVNKGQKIAEGTPQEVRQNPAVIEAYIGSRRHGAEKTADINQTTT